MFECLKEFGNLTKYKNILYNQPLKHYVLNIKPFENVDYWWNNFDFEKSKKRIPKLNMKQKHEILHHLSLLSNPTRNDDLFLQINGEFVVDDDLIDKIYDCTRKRIHRTLIKEFLSKILHCAEDYHDSDF